MPEPLLTPEEIITILRIKDRHTLPRLVARGVVERFNKGGSGNGARYLYRLKPLTPDQPPPDLEELHWQKIKRGHRL